MDTNLKTSMNIEIACVPFSQLTTIQLYEILRLRSEVFVLEQTCLYQDMDNNDTQNNVHHLMITSNNELVAYARLLPPNLTYSNPSIGRIIVAPQARSLKLGRFLIAHCIENTRRLWPDQAITIGAQTYLLALYQSFGFVEVSEHYLEDGIPHVDMQLQ